MVSITLEHEAQMFGFGECFSPLAVIGSPQQMQMRGFIGSDEEVGEGANKKHSARLGTSCSRISLSVNQSEFVNDLQSRREDFPDSPESQWPNNFNPSGCEPMRASAADGLIPYPSPESLWQRFRTCGPDRRPCHSDTAIWP